MITLPPFVSSLTTEAAREKVGFEIPMLMPIAALRDPANETPLADHMGWRAA